MPADVSEYPQSQSFVLEAEITDLNNEVVASRTTVVVHKGKFYIGLRPQQYVGATGKEQAVDVITVDTKGITVTNQTVAMSFYQRQWFSVREKQVDGSFAWRNSFTDTLVSDLTLPPAPPARPWPGSLPPRAAPTASWPRDRRRRQQGPQRHLPVGVRHLLRQLADGGQRPDGPRGRQEGVRPW